MKITTFPKVNENENPFKEYKDNDFSIDTLVNKKWNKRFFKKDEEGTYIQVMGSHFDLIPLGRPSIHRDKEKSIGMYAMGVLRPTLGFNPLKQTVNLSSFQGVSATYEMKNFVRVPDEIMTKMIRYALSQPFIEGQRYTMDVPYGNKFILDGGSWLNAFIIGRHHLEESNVEIFYDPKHKGFTVGVWQKDHDLPSNIYIFLNNCERNIVYLEKNKEEGYTFCNGGFFGSNGLCQNVSYGPIIKDGKLKEMWSIPTDTFLKIDSADNYFKARDLGELIINKNVKVPDKHYIEEAYDIGIKLRYRFHNHKS